MTIRKPLQLVGIEADYCSLVYGTGSCTAVLGSTGERKCFNFYHGCQDKPNFSRTPLLVLFGKDQSGLPKDRTVFPFLQSVSTSPTKITLGATDGDSATLGKRARIKVKLQDRPDDDKFFDKYQKERKSGAAQADGIGYRPEKRGTALARLRARWPYYYGRTLRVYNGYVGDTLAEMDTRTYIVTEWEGPGANGEVQITAQDPLKLADEDLSQCPIASKGELASNLNSSSLGTVDLQPAGIGAEYSAFGRISIGSEVLSYTRSGDTLTITGRGLDGTEQASHGQGDTVQECFRCENEKLQDVLYRILVDYCKLDPAMITIADWDSEIDRWMPTVRLTRTIPKPQGVRKLLIELMDLGVIIWWDERAQQVRLQANRPLDYDEELRVFTDNDTTIAGTLQRESLDKQRLSQVWFFHGLKSVADAADSSGNYDKVSVAQALEAESANEYDQTKIKVIYCPWFGLSGDDVLANTISTRLLQRFRDTPDRVTFQADIKDLNELELARQVQFVTRVLQDEDGSNIPFDVKVESSDEIVPGHRLKVSAITWNIRGRYGFITENTRGTYAVATAEEKRLGTYMVDGTTLTFGDGTGPYIIF